MYRTAIVAKIIYYLLLLDLLEGIIKHQKHEQKKIVSLYPLNNGKVLHIDIDMFW